MQQIGKLVPNREVSIKLEPAQIQVRADRTRLRQVLLILLDNALRFTPADGKIQLSAKLNGKWVEINVTDSGQGIPPEHLAHLFDRFYQVTSPENEGSRPNGLGLSIARSLIEAQNGSIHIKSELEKGTTISLRFPAP